MVRRSWRRSWIRRWRWRSCKRVNSRRRISSSRIVKPKEKDLKWNWKKLKGCKIDKSSFSHSLQVAGTGAYSAGSTPNAVRRKKRWSKKLKNWSENLRRRKSLSLLCLKRVVDIHCFTVTREVKKSSKISFIKLVGWKKPQVNKSV